jgi:serine/threonine protein kinase
LRGEPASQPEAAPMHLGRYQVRSTLGAGAFGTVYLAYDPELHRDVAIKVSRADPLSSGEKVKVRADAVAAEARHAARLNHAGIVSVYDVGREGERL